MKLTAFRCTAERRPSLRRLFLTGRDVIPAAGEPSSIWVCVLTDEHGEGWRRGTFEWDFTLIPVVEYYVNGRHYYMGGLKPSPRAGTSPA